MVDVPSRSSPICRANSRSRSRARRPIARRRWCTISACTRCATTAGEIGFRVLVGGGLGRTPIIGHVIREFLPREEILNYLDAILRVYNRFGRRDNKYKARIKILVKEMTLEVFTQHVEAEWERLQGGPATVPDEEIERIAAFFAPPPYERLPGDDAGFRARRGRQPRVRQLGQAQRLPAQGAGLRRGHAVAEEDRRAAGRCDLGPDGRGRRPGRRYSFGEIRVSHEQNLIFAHVRQAALLALWGELKALGLRHAEHRPADRHHLLPGRRLLLAGQRQVDPDRRSDPAALRRSRLPARHRRDRPQHLGLHERLRPPPRRQHRHARRRQERRRVVPGLDRRRPGRACVAGQGDRSVVRRARDARRRRDA